VSFDYQYDISGKYQQRLDQQYKVKRLVYNGFIAANLINGVTRHDDYLIFKLKKVPQQAVNCTTEIPPLDTELTMIHHPQGMLKKASIGQLTSITDTHENKLTLSSDLQHNIAGWAGSSGAGLYWAQQDRVCAIQLANDHCASHAHNEHSSSKAISLKRISDDITASPLFERNKDVRIVHRLLQGQGLFKSAVKPRSSTGQPESSANRYRLA